MVNKPLVFELKFYCTFMKYLYAELSARVWTCVFARNFTVFSLIDTVLSDKKNNNNMNNYKSDNSGKPSAVQ